MGYDFRAKNPEAGSFHLGAFSWPVLLDQCGCYFLTIHRGPQWHMVTGVDPRDPEGATYPGILANDGYQITEEEAKVLARIARNYVTIQRMLPKENRGGGAVQTGEALTRDKLMEAVARTISGTPPSPDPWPLKIRDDFVDKFAAFADWAEKSGGFTIH